MLTDETKKKISAMIEADDKFHDKKEFLKAIRECLIQNGIKVDDDTYNPNEKGISIRR